MIFLYVVSLNPSPYCNWYIPRRIYHQQTCLRVCRLSCREEMRYHSFSSSVFLRIPKGNWSFGKRRQIEYLSSSSEWIKRLKLNRNNQKSSKFKTQPISLREGDDFSFPPRHFPIFSRQKLYSWKLKRKYFGETVWESKIHEWKLNVINETVFCQTRE